MILCILVDPYFVIKICSPFFTVLFAFTHYISVQAGKMVFLDFIVFNVTLYFLLSFHAEIWYLGILCYVLGVYFCYIATEKYEVHFCIHGIMVFDIDS